MGFELSQKPVDLGPTLTTVPKLAQYPSKPTFLCNILLPTSVAAIVDVVAVVPVVPVVPVVAVVAVIAADLTANVVVVVVVDQ